MHRHIAWEQWEVEVVQSTTTLIMGSGRWKSCNAAPHCLGAVDAANPAMQRHVACGQCSMELLHATTTLPLASGQ